MARERKREARRKRTSLVRQKVRGPPLGLLSPPRSEPRTRTERTEPTTAADRAEIAFVSEKPWLARTLVRKLSSPADKVLLVKGPRCTETTCRSYQHVEPRRLPAEQAGGRDERRAVAEKSKSKRCREVGAGSAEPVPVGLLAQGVRNLQRRTKASQRIALLKRELRLSEPEERQELKGGIKPASPAHPGMEGLATECRRADDQAQIIMMSIMRRGGRSSTGKRGTRSRRGAERRRRTSASELLCTACHLVSHSTLPALADAHLAVALSLPSSPAARSRSEP